MSPLDPFYIYRVANEQGDLLHSSILYDSELQPGQAVSDAEVREALLLGASYAEGESEFPVAGAVIEIYGPFFPADPTDKISAQDWKALPEDVRYP